MASGDQTYNTSLVTRCFAALSRCVCCCRSRGAPSTTRKPSFHRDLATSSFSMDFYDSQSQRNIPTPNVINFALDAQIKPFRRAAPHNFDLTMENEERLSFWSREMYLSFMNA